MNSASRANAALVQAGASLDKPENLMSTKLEIPVQPDFAAEVQEWIEAFDEVVVAEGPEQGAELLDALRQRAREAGITPPAS